MYLAYVRTSPYQQVELKFSYGFARSFHAKFNQLRYCIREFEHEAGKHEQTGGRDYKGVQNA
jgi:hypothetical protein